MELVGIRDFTAMQSYQLKHFCKQHKQALPKQDTQGEALFINTRLIGLVKLYPMPNDGQYWLRGLYIDPDFRHQGLARLLMNEVHSKLKADCQITLFSLQHLTEFYKSLGYQETTEQHLSVEIKELWQKSVADGKNWVLMRKIL